MSAPFDIAEGRRLLKSLRLCEAMNDAYGVDGAYTDLARWMVAHADDLLGSPAPGEAARESGHPAGAAAFVIAVFALYAAATLFWLFGP